MDFWDKSASDDGWSPAMLDDFGHEALQHLLIIIVITSEGLQQVFQTYLYWQGQLWVLQANKVPFGKKKNPN